MGHPHRQAGPAALSRGAFLLAACDYAGRPGRDLYRYPGAPLRWALFGHRRPGLGRLGVDREPPLCHISQRPAPCSDPLFPGVEHGHPHAAGDLIPIGQVYAVKLGNAQSGRSIAFVGAGIAAGVALMGAATLDRLAQVSYTVEVEHGGQETVLAGGLTETQARAACAEVNRRLAENT